MLVFENTRINASRDPGSILPSSWMIREMSEVENFVLFEDSFNPAIS
jgi:hypothetical protein